MSVKPPTVSDSGDDPSQPNALAASARRVRNPHGQGGRLRAELVAAADRILAQTGDLEALSLRGVAREVGVATPSIYLHFPDKRALVHAVLAERFAQLGAAVRTAVTAGSDPADQLRAGCLAYCCFATEHPNAYRVLFGRQPASPGVRPNPDPVSQGDGAKLPLSAPERGLGGRGDTGDVGDTGIRQSRGAQLALSAANGFVEADIRAQHGPWWDVEGSSVGTGGEVSSVGAGSEASPARAGGEFSLPVGADAFMFLVDGAAACMKAGLAPPGDPLRAAIGIWTALHGIVTLRASVPHFPWPPLQQQIDDILSGLVGLRHSSVTGETATPE